jgi:hypothetical protein
MTSNISMKILHMQSIKHAMLFVTTTNIRQQHMKQTNYKTENYKQVMNLAGTDMRHLTKHD